MTNDELKNLGFQLGRQLQCAAEAWHLAVTCLPKNSRQYKAICRAGKRTQDAYIAIEAMAVLQLSLEDFETHFVINTAYGFN